MVQVGSKLVSLLLILVMAVGSVVLWLGVPIAWIYGASQLVSSSQPSMGPYVMVMVGIPVSMVLVGKALSKLNRVYGVVTHTTPEVRVVAPWRRSMRDGREAGHPRTVLDVVMVASVMLALLCMGVWFFFFAEGGGI